MRILLDVRNFLREGHVTVKRHETVKSSPVSPPVIRNSHEIIND
jgi:hypothetical protein